MTLVIQHSSCPKGIVGKYNHSFLAATYNDLGEELGTTTQYYERDDWRHTPASCGTVACFKAISSFNDAVVSDMKTGFTV
jgi:hypothetical protein